MNSVEFWGDVEKIEEGNIEYYNQRFGYYIDSVMLWENEFSGDCSLDEFLVSAEEEFRKENSLGFTWGRS